MVGLILQKLAILIHAEEEFDTLCWVKAVDDLDQPKDLDLHQVLIWDSSLLKPFGEALQKALVHTDHQPAVPFLSSTRLDGLSDDGMMGDFVGKEANSVPILQRSCYLSHSIHLDSF